MEYLIIDELFIRILAGVASAISLFFIFTKKPVIHIEEYITEEVLGNYEEVEIDYHHYFMINKTGKIIMKGESEKNSTLTPIDGFFQTLLLLSRAGILSVISIDLILLLSILDLDSFILGVMMFILITSLIAQIGCMIYIRALRFLP